MKPAWNRGKRSDVVLVMERSEEPTGEWLEDGPMTKRCVYVQDRDSQRWSAHPVTASGDAGREASPE